MSSPGSVPECPPCVARSCTPSYFCRGDVIAQISQAEVGEKLRIQRDVHARDRALVASRSGTAKVVGDGRESRAAGRSKDNVGRVCIVEIAVAAKRMHRLANLVVDAHIELVLVRDPGAALVVVIGRAILRTRRIRQRNQVEQVKRLWREILVGDEVVRKRRRVP
jgi:hypothetical protein